MQHAVRGLSKAKEFPAQCGIVSVKPAKFSFLEKLS
jgi:hypothetical protein